MNAFATFDPETFLRYAADHPELRLELERGRIVQQMTGGTKRHAGVATEIFLMLCAQIDRRGWSVLAERGVFVAPSVRYPDIVVEPTDEPGDSLSTKRPNIIVEVLSPPSVATDLNTKPTEYLSIATLDAYIVANQSEPAMVIWQRRYDGTFPTEPSEVSGLDATLVFKAHGQDLKLGFHDIYSGLL